MFALQFLRDDLPNNMILKFTLSHSYVTVSLRQQSEKSGNFTYTIYIMILVVAGSFYNN